MTALEFSKAFYLQLLQGGGEFLGAGKQEALPSPSHLVGSGGNLWIVLPQSFSLLWWWLQGRGLAAMSPHYLFPVVAWAPILLCQACRGKDR